MTVPPRAALPILLLSLGAQPGRAQTELQVLQPFDSTAGDEFGVAVSASGPFAVVRSKFGAYVYERIGGTWTESQALAFDSPYSESNLGPSVALHQDLAAIGLPTAETAPGLYFGLVELFEQGPGGWSYVTTLVPEDPQNASSFGYAVDRDEAPGPRRVLVGDPLRNLGFVGVGGAYLFEEGPGGWTQVQRFQAFDAGAFDWYGMSVAIHGDRIAIGARFEDAGIQNSGAVYLYRRDASGTYELEQKLISPEPMGFGEFGRSMDLTEDWLAVSEIRADKNGTETGAVHLYRDPAGFFEYSQRVVADEVGEYDSFGISVDLQGDILAVGASYDDQIGIDEGAAYVFRQYGGAWYQTSRYTSDQLVDGSLLGWSVSLSDDALLCGTLQDYGSGVGAPGTLHGFDAEEPTTCTTYTYGEGLPGVTEMLWFTDEPAAGPFLIAVSGPDVGSSTLLAVSANPGNLSLLGLPVLVDLVSTTVVPMVTSFGFALTIANLPAPSGGFDALYLQAFSYTPASATWAASTGLRVALCP